MLYLQQTSGGGGEERRGEHVSHQTWLAEVENEATAISVCGLEISFQSIPQERSIFLYDILNFKLLQNFFFTFSTFFRYKNAHWTVFISFLVAIFMQKTAICMI